MKTRIEMSPVKIIYLAGSGHSGSTLLGRLLDQHPAIASIGSMRGIESALKGETTMCSCGSAAEECPRWGEVLASVRKEGGGEGDCRQAPGESWLDSTRRIVATFLEVSGASFLCEATHEKERPWLYARSDIGQLYVVHLVRDPRGVAYSYGRKRKNIWWTALALHLNSLSQELHRLRFSRNSRVHHLRIRYEDLCANPSETLHRIASFAGLPTEPFQAEALNFGSSHLLGGNRMRHLPLSEIRQSTKFATESSGRWWGLATALTLPLLVRYGYPLSRKAIPCGSKKMNPELAVP